MSESRHAYPDGSTHHDPGLGRVESSIEDREYDWPLYALISGVIGAFIVAIVFLVVDLASGRPMLWTPAALGSALFLGEKIGAGSDLVPFHRLGIVFAYTMMHGAFFVAFGALAASERLTRRHVRELQTGPALLTALLLFLGFEATFALLGWLAGPNLDLAARLGTGWVALANALAALGMTATVVLAARRIGRREAEREGGKREGTA